MAMVSVATGSRIQADSRPKSTELRVGGHLAPNHIHQMNRVNSDNDFKSWWQHYKHWPELLLLLLLLFQLGPSVYLAKLHFKSSHGCTVTGVWELKSKRQLSLSKWLSNPNLTSVTRLQEKISLCCKPSHFKGSKMPTGKLVLYWYNRTTSNEMLLVIVTLTQFEMMYSCPIHIATTMGII